MAIWIMAGVMAGLAALVFPSEAKAQQRPNVIVIVVDDLRSDGIAAGGHPFVSTPNIDRIAIEGITFSNAFATTPLCSPSRASFYSGRYTRNHRIRDNTQGNSVSDTTLWTWARGLQTAGYHTGHVGKWHMDPTSAPRFGFDSWVGFLGQGAHLDPILNVNGIETFAVGYTTEILSDYAIDFIQSDHAGRPFALSLAYKGVHGPYPSDNGNVPPEFRALYQNIVIQRPPSARVGYSLAGKPALQNPPPPLQPPVPGVTGAGVSLIRNQLVQTTYLDYHIGRVVEALEQSDLLDQTLLVFTSDNGNFWGEHGLSDKRGPYEESIGIPLMARLPGLIQQGTTSPALVGLLDIGPTLLALADVVIPNDVDGVSLLSEMSNPTGSIRSSILLEYFHAPDVPLFPDWKAIRTDRWKYINYPAFGSTYDELYDLTADPFEMSNLIQNHSVAAIRLELKQALSTDEESLVPDEDVVIVPGDPADFQIAENGTSQLGGISMTAGSRGITPIGGRNAVVALPVPVLEPGEEVLTASPILTPATYPPHAVPSTTHADVWLLGIGPSAPVVPYLEANADQNSGPVKLIDNLFWWDRGYGSAEANPVSARILGQTLMSFYASHPGYAGGSKLWLRVNPDANTGNADAGWQVISTEHMTPGLRPALRLTIKSPDGDGDGLSNRREQQNGTDPGNADSDGDGLGDGVEDGRGVFVDENLTGTSPLNADSDGDGVDDGVEVDLGSDPNQAGAAVPFLDPRAAVVACILLLAAGVLGIRRTVSSSE